MQINYDKIMVIFTDWFPPFPLSRKKPCWVSFIILIAHAHQMLYEVYHDNIIMTIFTIPCKSYLCHSIALSTLIPMM